MTNLLRGAEVQELRDLREQGLSITEIGRLTGYSRNTVRKYLRDPGVPVYGPRAARASKLDGHKEYLAGRLRGGAWNATVLLRELRARGYTGSYTILKDYLAPLRGAARVAAARRFETPPGRQAQVDWGYVGTVVVDGVEQSLWAFVMTLGHSRGMFAEIVTEQSLGVLLRLHEEAFAALGGVPEEILYDNMKTVATGYTDRGEASLQPVFADFARHWCFRVRVCRPYRPQTKGKVESGVGYLRKSFLCGREASSVDDLRSQLGEWLATVANRRVHGTTHRVVAEALAEEQPHLRPVTGRSPYPYVPEETRRVSVDCYVEFRTNRYSVPWTAAGRRVTVRERGDRLEVVLDGAAIAEHPLCHGRYQVLTQRGHHAGMPFSPSGPRRSSKARITVIERPPEVEVRSLAAYESLSEGAAGC
jgi:transposase